jgi:hypothetical protein
LALLRAIDVTQTDALGMSVVEDFDSVAIENGDGRGGMVGVLPLL